LQLQESPRLHYEGLQICNTTLAIGGGDLRWQITSQVYPWYYVKRRLQNVIDHLGDYTYPVIQEIVPGDYKSQACSGTTIISWTKEQAGETKKPLSHQYLALSEKANWKEKILIPGKYN